MVHIHSHVTEDSARHTVGNNVLWEEAGRKAKETGGKRGKKKKIGKI